MNKSSKNKRGRPAEAPSLRTQDLYYLADSLKCHPFEVLIHFAKGDYEALGYKEKQTKITKDGMEESYTISPELRAKAAEKACEYLFPKRKAVEHSFNPTKETDELVADTMRLVQEIVGGKE